MSFILDDKERTISHYLWIETVPSLFYRQAFCQPDRPYSSVLTTEDMPQLARWLTLIEQYDYKVVHRYGNQHANADDLSRRPTMPSNTDGQQVQTTRVHAKSEIPSSEHIRRRRRTKSARALALLDDSDLTMVKSVVADATSAPVTAPSEQL